MRLFFSLVIANALLASCVGSQPDRYEIESKLTAEANALIQDFDLPGMTVAIASDGDLITVAVGFADRENGRLMTSETPMLAASIGKTFVSASILRLIEDEKLQLDDPISNWLGEHDWFASLPNANDITIRHLLQHTSGLPDHVHMEAFRKMGLARAAEVGPESLIALVLDTEPLFPVDENWSYSDTGYLLLGLILESELDQSYYPYIQAKFLIPLQLSSTGPSNRKNISDLARGYVFTGSELELPPYTTDDNGVMLWDPSIEWTGGGLYSTSHNLAIWGREFLSGRLHKPETYAQAIKGVATTKDDVTSSYGLGISISHDSNWGRAYGHRGWIPGYVSSLQYYPDYDVAIAFQTNTDIGIIDVEEPILMQIEELLTKVALEKNPKRLP